jgi:1-acyl-sn-glycerol-3-phosphate acyltransferase
MRVFSVAYWAFIALSCLPFFAVAVVLLAITYPFDRRRVVLHLFTCFWGAYYIYCNPLWHLRVVGREKLRWRGPAVLVANHASLIDIVALFRLYRPFKWVSKAANFRLPFIGWNMTLNDYVPVVRGNKDSIVQMMEDCRRHLRRGSPVLLFPEGTRTRDGELLPFKEGAFQLAAEMRCPLVPIAIHGTGEVLPKHGMILRQRMYGLVEVLDPIAVPAVGDCDAGVLRERAREAIADALARRRGTILSRAA